MIEQEKYARLGRPKRIWAIAAIHGVLPSLVALHQVIASRFQPGERLVYLGNYSGFGGQAAATVDEILAFRRSLLAMSGMLVDDIVYLRGSQEEMWHKLQQLQFAPNPVHVLDWMEKHGIASTIEDYGSSMEQARHAAREGVIALTRWTNNLRGAMRRMPGHDRFHHALRRAAFTQPAPEGATLFVNAGIDVTRPLDAQSDSFWWSGQSFDRISDPYGPFTRIVRGFDPSAGGLHLNEVTLSLDANAGRGGKLMAALLSAGGEVHEFLEV